MTKSKKFGVGIDGKRLDGERLILELDELIDSLQELPSCIDHDQNQKQLKEISKTVAKLEEMNVQIPDELTQLSGTLLSKVSEAENVESLLRFLNVEFIRLQDKSRNRRSTSAHQRVNSTEPTLWS